MSNPYIIFVGNAPGELEPYKSAPDSESAIDIAIQLADAYSCVEAIYMPEDDLDTNDIVYSNYNRRSED